ncbi:2,3-diaminopropionate biosynthesis protein SbnB [Pseudomonas sp. UBA1879]|uniref:2,3-diaminopropionate biosynthesis protein SbnB n=1 Tax=Pseudomonas sp. UBA1879 TaxID=1947305 RepID=UPI0025DDB7AD|nr:2,3-diaminopropionate biosynthesis protein SbnB [Pseudomonas sp. UBA1879]
MSEFHVIPGAVIKDILERQAHNMVARIEQVYLQHHDGQTLNPDSYFLRFPQQPANRIIALPASLEGEDPVAGIKWISSFPGNVAQQKPRASAVVILNDRETGYPYACLEGAQISAVRTAASAVSGAYWLNGQSRKAGSVGFIGAGVIARNIARMLAVEGWEIAQAIVHDFDDASALALKGFVENADLCTARTGSLKDALAADLVIFATTAGEPYVAPPVTFRAGQVVLNISLRDIAPQLLLAANNLCDDVEHCMKANTSPHLAEQLTGSRAFMNGTLAGLIRGEVQLDPNKPSIFSPFGLGVLDLALSKYVVDTALAESRAVAIDSFFGETLRWN